MGRLNLLVDNTRWTAQEFGDVDCVERQVPACAGLETAFQRRMPIPVEIEPNLGAALRHLLSHPGSMVRPRVVFRLGLAYGIEQQAAIDLAIALEYFHTASLVFDDLPCMDNAQMRRGATCVHVQHGDSGAILAALALINRAYALVWRAAARSPHVLQQMALKYLEERLGVGGLLNGQSLDLHFDTLPHNAQSTVLVARGKTVSLIELTLCLPAILGGASRRELQLLERISNCWGMSYQIVDDLKDLLQSSSESGKTAARDASLNRPNLALAGGVPYAIERLVRLLRAGDRNVETLLSKRSSLAFLREFRAGMDGDLNRVLAGAGISTVEGEA